jgi:hypothetical protein
MKLTPIDLSQIPETGNGNATRHRIRQIEAFLESGAEAAELTEFGPGTANNVASALNDAAKAHRYRAHAISRGDRVFLIRDEKRP